MSIVQHVFPSVAATIRRPYLSGVGLVAFLALAHAATDAVTSAVGALLPSIQVRLALTESSLALFVATLAIGASIAQPFLGALGDRVGRHLLVGIGALLAAAAISLVGVVSSAFLVLFLLFVGGLGSAAIHPSGASAAREGLAGRPGLAVSLFSAGGTAGVALGPLIVLAVVAWAGLAATPWLMIPGLLLGAAALLLIPPERRSPGGAYSKPSGGPLFVGPVGLLALTEVASSLAYLTFASTVPLWLVGVHGVARDGALIGWTLAALSLAAALGGIVAGLLAPRVGRRLLVVGTTLLAPLPLLALFRLEPGSTAYFAAAGLAGILVNAGLPLKVVAAQEWAPRAVATASGMLMGFAMGIAGLLYVGVGALQESIGLVPAASVAYAALVPAALLAFGVLGRHDATARTFVAGPTALALAVMQCSCSRGYAPPTDPSAGAACGIRDDNPAESSPARFGAAGCMQSRA